MSILEFRWSTAEPSRNRRDATAADDEGVPTLAFSSVVVDIALYKSPRPYCHNPSTKLRPCLV